MNPWQDEDEDEAEEDWRRRLRRGKAAGGAGGGGNGTSTGGSGGGSLAASAGAGAAGAAAAAPEPAHVDVVARVAVAVAAAPSAEAGGAEGAWDAADAVAVAAATAGGEWLPALDPGGSGATYWYNARTGESSWVPPPGMGRQQQQEEEGQGEPPPSSGVGAAAVAAVGDGEGEGGGVVADADDAASADAGALPPALPAVVDPPVPTLPPAVARLQRALDVADGSSSGGGAVDSAPSTAAAAAMAAVVEDNREREGHEAGDGERGWVELLDKTWGRLYYYNTGTGRTQWECPPGFQGDTVAPAYEPPPRPFTATAAAHVPTAAATTADAIASWVAEAQHDQGRVGLPPGATQELSVYEEMGYRASLNKRTGQVMIRGPMFERAEDDRDRRQLAHFVDLEALDRNRAQEARRRQAGRGQQQLGPDDWRRIREEKKARKRRREVDWLLHD